MFDMFCSCEEFTNHKTCVHRTSIENYSSNRIRLLSFEHRDVTATNINLNEGEWNLIKAPERDVDNTGVWLVFMRRILSSLFRTTSVVLLEKRKNVPHKGAVHRVQCVVSKGLSSNRSICIHERAVVNAD